jgi:hypothetical protein
MVRKVLDSSLSSDPRQAAGVAAETQMAFYLHRSFGTSNEIDVINDLRIVDPEQPDPKGRPGIFQIDHLVVHPWGVFIVESKSVTGQVVVRDHGNGDEWVRVMGRREQGMSSPIQQVRRQEAMLRKFLHAHRSSLRGRVAPGLRTLARVLAGTDQCGFEHMPIQAIIAISDNGIINRPTGWTERATPFRDYVCKADLVPDRIRDEVERHRAGSRLMGASDGHYGVWSIKPDELAGVIAFLCARHEPRTERDSTGGALTGATPACMKCGQPHLLPRWGDSRRGYVWTCRECAAQTPISTVCSACGAQGERGRVVKVKKEGRGYFRVCQKCGIEERIWLEPETGPLSRTDE